MGCQPLPDEGGVATMRVALRSPLVEEGITDT
jgi:hypothetical protein